ncbi:hypothetical protein AHAS_Ahas19G0086900 [Arachis hypogaea]
MLLLVVCGLSPLLLLLSRHRLPFWTLLLLNHALSRVLCLLVVAQPLIRIAVGCSRLERLSLKWCFEISDLGVDLLCKKCFYLKDIFTLSPLSLLKTVISVPHYSTMCRLVNERDREIEKQSWTL